MVGEAWYESTIEVDEADERFHFPLGIHLNLVV
jgi:hypothetical protein